MYFVILLFVVEVVIQTDIFVECVLGSIPTVYSVNLIYLVKSYLIIVSVKSFRHSFYQTFRRYLSVLQVY